MKKSASYCPLLWNGLSNRDGESLYPCCRFEYEGSAPFDLPSNPRIEELINNNVFQEARKKALQGLPISNCFKCYQDEKETGHSDRLEAIAEFPDEFTETEVRPADISVLELFIGRTCNLKCHSCNPALSTKWSEDYQKLSWSWPVHERQHPLATHIPELQGLQTLKIIGGEPALSKETEQVILGIHDKGQVRVELSTNATIPLSAAILASVPQFQFFQVSLSIDGFGQVNELIRFPSKWAEIERNALRYLDFAEKNKKFELVLHCTVSALNIFSLPDLKNWWLKLCDGRSLRSKMRFIILRSPSFLSATGLSPENRQNAENMLAPHPEFKHIVQALKMAAAEKSYVSEVKSYCESLDQVRRTETRSVLPHLFE